MSEITRIYLNIQLNELGMYFFGFLIYLFYLFISNSLFLGSLAVAANLLGVKTRKIHVGKIALIRINKRWVITWRNQPFRISGSVRFEKNLLEFRLREKLTFFCFGVLSSVFLITFLILRPFLVPIVNPDYHFLAMLRFLNLMLPFMELVFLFFNLQPNKFDKNYYTLGYIVFHRK